MKPGQQLHIVNELYSYTVQFKEDPTGDRGGIKRPREPIPEDRESHREASSMKAAKQTENVTVSASPEETTKPSVRDERKRGCMYSRCCFYEFHMFFSCMDFLQRWYEYYFIR